MIKCAVDGCPKVARYGGVCEEHADVRKGIMSSREMNVCSVDGCPKLASYAGGVCEEHADVGRVRRELERAGLVGEVNTDKCSVDGCSETRLYGPLGTGVCAKHEREYAAEPVDAHIEAALRQPACKDQQGPRCKPLLWCMVDGCSGRPIAKSGLCIAHLGGPDVALCSHPGCESEASIQLCAEHAGSFIARLDRLLKAWATSGPSASELWLVLETFESELRARIAIAEARRGK